jgi:hypothetical protein
MFYLTYRFNETAIITVTVRALSIKTLKTHEQETPLRELAEFDDAMGTRHTIESATIISIVPAPIKKRKRGTC